MLVPLLLVAAFVYGSAGFGGGTAYVALFALFALPQAVSAPLALVLNILVAGVTAFRTRHALRAGLLVPLLAGSVPGAALGGMSALEPTLFHVGTALAFGVAAILLVHDSPHAGPLPARLLTRRTGWLLGPPIGSMIGALAGLIGIGGGIFLGPLLHFSGRVPGPAIPALTSSFIVANSACGLLARGATLGLAPATPWLPVIPLVAAAGFLGSRAGNLNVPVQTLRKLTAAILTAAGVRLLWMAGSAWAA